MSEDTGFRVVPRVIPRPFFRDGVFLFFMLEEREKENERQVAEHQRRGA